VSVYSDMHWPIVDAGAMPPRVDFQCNRVPYGQGWAHNGTDFNIGASFRSLDPNVPVCEETLPDDFPDAGVGCVTPIWRNVSVTAAADGEVVGILNSCFDACRDASNRCARCPCITPSPLGAGLGNQVVVRANNGDVHFYGHLRRGSVLVRVGEQVSCGQTLGLVGSSGCSTGPHLHFEVRRANRAIDPFAGPCSQPTSLWAFQGAYHSLPSSTCTSVCSSICADSMATTAEATACVGQCRDGVCSPLRRLRSRLRRRRYMCGRHL
jgi:murein DD-endopeptidase MepM/ murein hydrolase activator NlpD